MKIPADIQQAIQAYYAERATPEDIAALENWFRADEAHIKVFAEHGMVEWQMHCEHEKLEAAAVLSILREAEENAEPDFSLLHTPAFETTSAITDDDALTLGKVWSAASYALDKGLRSKAGVIGSIAAVLVLGVLLYIWFFAPGNTPNTQEIAGDTPTKPAESAQSILRDQTVATLTATHNAQWAQASSAPGSLTPGSKLRPNQRLTLTAGFAEVTTARGAIAILEAPATIELIDNDNAIQLLSGKLVGICETESSKGFVVRTPRMDITDLGTRFGVDASQADATEVHVYDGQVEVSRPAVDGSRPHETTLVVEGQAVRAQAGGVGLTPIPAVFGRFARGLGFIRLPGTGYGLEPSNHVDTNWELFYLNGQHVRTRVPMLLSTYPGANGQTPNDPDLGQWLQLEDPGQYQGDEEAEYTFSTTFHVPEGIDLDRAVLHVDYHADEHLTLVGFNHAANPAWRAAARNNPTQGRVSLTLSEQQIRHGKNIAHFYVRNAPGTELYLHVSWTIEADPSTRTD